MRNINRHFPPVRHKWATSAKRAAGAIARYNTTYCKTGLASSSDDLCAINPQSALMKMAEDLGGLTTLSSDVSSIGHTSNMKPVVVMPSPTLHQHRGLATLTFDILAKRPIIPIVTLADLRREIATQLALAALQFRWICVCMMLAESSLELMVL
jgi:hypothetical protein